jgi:serine/threonine protein kinase
MVRRAQQQLPATIGGYRVLGRLAVSEMATTFKGRHPSTGEVVAIKVAGPAVLDDPGLLARFGQEYTVTRGLDHPHLVRALRYGQVGETPYMVLEYVDGPSLGECLERQGRFPEAAAVRLAIQVGEALHYAHQHRIVHRDVKPDNILLAPGERAKLADLGLAKDRDAESHLTRAGIGLGTPNYMAPEQFSDAKNADRRCDIYSLGATLYAAVTGELPFRGRGAVGIWKKKLANDLVPPRKFVPDLSPHVEAAIRRAVDANPQARQASCMEFIEDLNGGSQQPATHQAARAGRTDRRATVRYPSGRGSSCQPLREGKGVRWQATVQDVSADGMGLVLRRRFEPRTVLSVDLEPTAGGPARRMLVRVARVTPLESRRWLLGCVFAARLGDEEVQALL